MVYTKALAFICMFSSISSVFGSDMPNMLQATFPLNTTSVTIYYNKKDVEVSRANGIITVTSKHTLEEHERKTKMEQFDSFARATTLSGLSVLTLSRALLWPYPVSALIGVVANVAAGHFIAKDRSLVMQFCAIILGTAGGIALAQYWDRLPLR